MPSLLRGVRFVVAAISRTVFFREVGPKVLPPLERITSKVTGGRLQFSGLLVPSLVLHTVGAKTGTERDTPLMYYPEKGGNMLVTGSNFARDYHPAWTANLMAHPIAAVSVRGRRQVVRATRLDEVEVERAWPAIERQWPGYREYERSSGRTLRIFRLQPQQAAADGSE